MTTANTAKAIEPEVMEPEQNGKGKKRALAKRESQLIARKEPEPGSIEDLMVRAVEQGNMDVIERVFELSEKARKERARSAFFEGLSRFQSLVPKIPKTKAGYGYFYAPLGEIEKQIKPHLE